MKRRLFTAIILIGLMGCQEPFDPVIDETTPLMVVDGLFCTDPAKTMVYVSMSESYNSNNLKTIVSGLTVYIIDEEGIRIDLHEIGSNGYYVTGANITSGAKIGKSYTLFIENKDGDIFKSTPQLVNECPEIDNISIKAANQTILSEDSYGDIQEVKSDGMIIYCDTKALLSKNNYYLYRFYGYEEQRALIGQERSEPYSLYAHRPISQLYTNIISTGYVNGSNLYLRQNEFTFIPKYSYQNYSWEIPETLTLNSQYFDGYIFISEQLSISNDAYNFWKSAQDQLNASSKIFDPVAKQITGNLSCINDPDKLILGVFYASDYTSRIDYMYMNSRNKTYIKELDSLPEIRTDSAQRSAPKGWISPPI